MKQLIGWSLALMLVAPCVSQAQSPQNGQKRRRAGAEGRPRDEAAKMIDAYLVSNLQESLGLSDEQFVRLLPLVKKLQTERRDFAQQRQRARRELRLQLESGRATEGQISESLKELKRIEVEGPPLVRRQVDAIDAQLSPLQQAKFRVVEMEVEGRVRELMLRAAGGRAGARRALDDLDSASGQE